MRHRWMPPTVARSNGAQYRGKTDDRCSRPKHSDFAGGKPNSTITGTVSQRVLAIRNAGEIRPRGEDCPARQAMLPDARQRPMSATARPGRSTATQTRSRATVQRIIDSTIALTIEKGAETVTMTEIAQRADIVIGAVYRYFEDKSAINRAILQQHNSYMEERIQRHLANIADADAFIHAMLSIYQMYDELRSREPMFGSLWSIVQGDSNLQALEAQATLTNAAHLLVEARKHFPSADDDALMASCVFALQLSATASHLNRTMPKALAQQMSRTHQQAIANALNRLR